MNIGQKVELYIKLRNGLDARRKEYKDYESEVKSEMDILEADILAEAEKTGVNSFATDHGTAYSTVKKYARSISKTDTEAYARKTGDFGLFTSHVNKAHVIELIEDGLDPSEFGVEYTEERAINIRKS